MTARITIVVLAIACATAHADTKADADTLFIAGERAYELKDYDGAARSFRAAYALVKDPVYLFNIAQAFRMARHCRQAQGFYRDFLAASPESRSRAAVEGWIRELEPCAVAEDDAERARLAAEKREREKLEREKRAATPIHREIDRGRPLRIAGLGT